MLHCYCATHHCLVVAARSLLLSGKMLRGTDEDGRCKVGVTEPIRISSGRAADVCAPRAAAAVGQTLTGHIRTDEPPPASTPRRGRSYTFRYTGAETFNGVLAECVCVFMFFCVCECV